MSTVAIERRKAPRDSQVDFDFDGGIPWSMGLDLNRNLLPVDTDSEFFNSLDASEKHATSWALGLLAASAIKEHEQILNELRHIAYPENEAKGNKFFLEEAVHSQAYQRFLDMAAVSLNITKEELASFLPKFKKSSIPAILYALEGKLGGNAIWWAVAATEEESIRLFQKISREREVTDEVFFTLNQLHFLEESRHSSFSYQMIYKKAGAFKNTLRKFSFGVSRVLQTVWLFQELNSFKNVKKLRHCHPLLENMARVSEKLEALTIRQKLKLILKDISYTRMMTRPEAHPRLRRALEKENVFILKLPEVL
jgi:hypothetical protein